jgi:hypothetical protein
MSHQLLVLSISQGSSQIPWTTLWITLLFIEKCEQTRGVPQSGHNLSTKNPLLIKDLQRISLIFEGFVFKT